MTDKAGQPWGRKHIVRDLVRLIWCTAGAATGIGLALYFVFMLVTKTVHPPAGANPLIMVHAHAGLSALWQPVGLGVLILALVAVVWSRLVPGMVHYPTKWFDRSPPSIWWGGWSD
jgi:CBS-domain-containing membrane protein